MISRRVLWIVIVTALLFPTVASFGQHFLFGGSEPVAQQIVYASGKIIQISIPLIFLFLLQKSKPQLPKPRRDGLALGLGFGVLVFLAMLVVYYAWLKPIGLFRGPDEAIRRQVTNLGLASTWKFIAFGVFISLVHSLFEEWYWRWFVFGRLRELISWKAALVISSVAFMTFHVSLLSEVLRLVVAGDVHFLWRDRGGRRRLGVDLSAHGIHLRHLAEPPAGRRRDLLRRFRLGARSAALTVTRTDSPRRGRFG